MPILDDYLVRIFPSDLIGCDNRGTKGVRLGKLVLGEPVSHCYCKDEKSNHKVAYTVIWLVH